MSSDKITLSADLREVTGKKVKSIRKDGLVPAVIYEKGKESINLHVPYMPLQKAYSAVGLGQPIEITMDKKKYLVMIKDVHMDPVKNTIMHVAFHAVNANEAIEAQVHLKMVGQAPASALGLLVRLNVDHITVKGLPGDMPDHIEVDVSEVTTEDDDIRAVSLNIPSNVEAVDFDPDRVIVSVTIPRAVVEEVEEETVDPAEVPSDNGGEKTESTEE